MQPALPLSDVGKAFEGPNQCHHLTLTWPCLPHGLHSPASRGSSTALDLDVWHSANFPFPSLDKIRLRMSTNLIIYNLFWWLQLTTMTITISFFSGFFFRTLSLSLMEPFWLRPAWPRNRLPPTRMVRMPSSQPGITCPVPTANSKGSPGLKVTGESWSLLIHKVWIILQ